MMVNAKTDDNVLYVFIDKAFIMCETIINWRKDWNYIFSFWTSIIKTKCSEFKFSSLIPFGLDFGVTFS